MSFHVFMSSFIYFFLFIFFLSFLSAIFCSFQCTSLSPPWLNLFQSIILLNAIVSRIIFLISFLDCLLQVYRNTADFCVLILYLSTLLNSLTSTNSYSVDYLNSLYVRSHQGLPQQLTGKEPAYECRRPGFNPQVGKIPWRRKWQLTAVVLPGKSHGQRSLAGYSPCGHKESNMTERLDNSNNKGHVICEQRCFTSSFPVQMIFVCFFLSLVKLLWQGFHHYAEQLW